MAFRPLYDRILVQRSKPEERTRSGLFIPTDARDALNEGKVIAVGHGRLQKDGSIAPLVVKVGDTVVFGKFAGDTVKANAVAIRADGEDMIPLGDCLFMREDDVLAIVDSVPTIPWTTPVPAVVEIEPLRGVLDPRGH